MFKKFILILLMAFSLNVHSQTLRQSWQKLPDDVKHVYAGVLISSVTGAVMYRLTDANTGWSVFAGFATGVTAGIVKEVVYDGMMRRGVVNNWDAFETAWGSIIGFTALRVGIDIREKRIDRQWTEMEKLEKLKKSEEFQNLNDSLSTPPLQVDSIPR